MSIALAENFNNYLNTLTDLELATNDKVIITLCESLRDLSDTEAQSTTVGYFLFWAADMVRREQEKCNDEDLL